MSEDPSEVADAGADLEESEAGSTAGSEYAGSDVVLEGVGVAAAEVSDGDGSEVGLWCEWSLVRSMLVDHVHKKRGGKPEVYLEGQISNDEPDDWLSKPAAPPPPLPPRLVRAHGAPHDAHTCTEVLLYVRGLSGECQ